MLAPVERARRAIPHDDSGLQHPPCEGSKHEDKGRPIPLERAEPQRYYTAHFDAHKRYTSEDEALVAHENRSLEEIYRSHATNNLQNMRQVPQFEPNLSRSGTVTRPKTPVSQMRNLFDDNGAETTSSINSYSGKIIRASTEQLTEKKSTEESDIDAAVPRASLPVVSSLPMPPTHHHLEGKKIEDDGKVFGPTSTYGLHRYGYPRSTYTQQSGDILGPLNRSVRQRQEDRNIKGIHQQNKLANRDTLPHISDPDAPVSPIRSGIAYTKFANSLEALRASQRGRGHSLPSPAPTFLPDVSTGPSNCFESQRMVASNIYSQEIDGLPCHRDPPSPAPSSVSVSESQDKGRMGFYSLRIPKQRQGAKPEHQEKVKPSDLVQYKIDDWVSRTVNDPFAAGSRNQATGFGRHHSEMVPARLRRGSGPRDGRKHMQAEIPEGWNNVKDPSFQPAQVTASAYIGHQKIVHENHHASPSYPMPGVGLGITVPHRSIFDPVFSPRIGCAPSISSEEEGDHKNDFSSSPEGGVGLGITTPDDLTIAPKTIHDDHNVEGEKKNNNGSSPTNIGRVGGIDERDSWHNGAARVLKRVIDLEMRSTSTSNGILNANQHVRPTPPILSPRVAGAMSCFDEKMSKIVNGKE